MRKAFTLSNSQRNEGAPTKYGAYNITYNGPVGDIFGSDPIID